MHGAFLRDHLPQPRSDRNWLTRRARARGDVLHVERTRSCRFADSVGAWHGALQLEAAQAVRGLQGDVAWF